MTATKNNSIFKKLGALAMAMCLTCALAVSAGAAEVTNADVTSYDVTLWKDDILIRREEKQRGQITA